MTAALQSPAHGGAGSGSAALPWGRLAVAACVLMLGSTALRSAWVGWLAWFPFVVTAIGAMVLVGILRRIGAATAIVILVAAAVPAIGMVAVGRRSGLGILDSITRPLPMLLTSAYPAPVTLPLLLPGLVIVWAAGAICGFGLRRRDYWAEPLVAGLLLLVVADLLTAGGSDMLGLISFGLVAVILIHWAMWGRRRDEPLPGLGTAVLVGAIALAVGNVPLGEAYQPRDQVRPEVKPSEEPNPLQWLSQWASEPDREVLRRQGDTFALHLAVLPEYDGRGFYSTSHYVPLGGAAEPSLPGGRFQVDQTVTVTWQPMSRWLPAPGMPRKVSVPDAQYDPETGSLLIPEFPQGVFGYTVTGTIDAPRRHEIAGANVGPAGRYTAVPDLPDAFDEYAKQVTSGAATYLDQAHALERALKQDRYFSAKAASGTSIGRVNTFLFTPADRGGRAGTSEQFAASFTLLARSLGIPTRLVVGFGSGLPLDPASRTSVVRGRDALAWPEVYFEGFGWVPFNPTPDVEEISVPNPNAQRSRPSPRPTPSSTPQATQPPETPPAKPDDFPWPPIAAALILAAVLGSLLAARAVRTRRQRRSGAVGAWQHVVDGLRLAGRGQPRCAGAPQLAAEAGITAASSVARAAEQESFAPAGTAVPPVWDDAVLARHELRRGAPWWRRAVWALNPQIFGHLRRR